MKKSILLATSAILAAGLVAVDAKAADVELYGQVNKGVVYFDDGVNEDFAIVDNDFSSTRFGLRGSKAINHGLTASFLIEGEVQDQDSSTFTQGAAGRRVADAGASGWTERHTRIGVAGNWGALFVGRTSTATDGVTEIDLAPAGDVSGSAMNRIGGGLAVQGTADDINGFVDNLDGIGANSFDGDRVSTVRYDSPIFNGVQARVAAAQGGAYDAAVYYNGKVAGLETAAGIGYVKFADSTTGAAIGFDEQYSGSVSVRHDSGLAATAAYGERSGEGGKGDARFGYLKAGYAWGAYGVAAEYGSYTGVAVDGQDAEVYGVAGQYDLGNGVSTAAYYRTFEADVTGAEDVDLFGVNLRVKF